MGNLKYFVAHRITHDYGAGCSIRSWHKLLGPFDTKLDAVVPLERIQKTAAKFNVNPNDLEIIRRGSSSPARLNGMLQQAGNSNKLTV